MEKYWILKDGEKVYTEDNTPKLSNKEKAYDYEMEAILAGLHTESFNEDEYYSLKWERMQDYF